MSRTTRARALLESIAWAAVLVLPWYFTVFTERVFEAEKMAALRALAIPALLTCAVLGASADVRRRLRARWRATAPAVRRLATAAVALWAIEGVTTLTSRVPLISLMGGYDRGFGWLSTTALVVLGVGAASLAEHPGGSRRLGAAIGGSAFPPALYGIFQRFGADPLPWLGDVVTRVSGSAGASVMLGAHMAMALPFALWATAGAYRDVTASAAEPDGRSGTTPIAAGRQLRLAAWLVIDVTALAALVLAGSRGPVLAAAGALTVVALAVAARAGRGWWVALIAGTALLGIGGLGALNRWPGAFGPIAHWPVFDRLAVAFDPERSTTRVRLRLWEGSVAAIDDLGLRQAVGTGPETMPLTWAAHYPSVLAYDEPRGWVPDRAHNLWLDRWLTTGVAGTLALLGVLVAGLLAAFEGLGLIKGRRQAVTAVAMWLGSATLAAAGARWLDGGWRLAAAAFGLGTVVGVALWLTAVAVARSRRRRLDGPSVDEGTRGDVDGRLEVAIARDTDRPDPTDAGLYLAALAMLIAFVVETQVGFVVTATAVLLWLTIGALIGKGAGAGKLTTGASASDPSDTTEWVATDGAVAAGLIGVTGLFDFGRAGLVGPGALGAAVLVGLAGAVVGVALGGPDVVTGGRADGPRRGAWRAVMGVWVGVVIAHLAALRLGTDGPSDAVPAAAATLVVWAVAVAVLIGTRATWAGMPATRDGGPAEGAKTTAIPGVGRSGAHSVRGRASTVMIASITLLAVAVCLSSTVADAAYKEGRVAWDAAVPLWRERGDSGRAGALLDGAEARYRLAASLASWEARYRLALGMTADVRGDLLTEMLVTELQRAGADDEAVAAANVSDEYDARLAGGEVRALALRRDAAFEGALDAFASALRLAPQDPVGSLAMARAWRVWGDLTREPERRSARLGSARAAYASVRALAPNWPEVLTEAAQVELLDGRIKAARPLAERALALDGFYYQGWKVIAQARGADGDVQGAAKAWAHYFDDPRNAGDVAALRARSAAQLQAGDGTGALTTARSVVRLAPDDARAWADLAVALDRTGARDEARAAAERAAGLSPGDDGIRRLVEALGGAR